MNSTTFNLVTTIVSTIGTLFSILGATVAVIRWFLRRRARRLHTQAVQAEAALPPYVTRPLNTLASRPAPRRGGFGAVALFVVMAIVFTSIGFLSAAAHPNTSNDNTGGGSTTYINQVAPTDTPDTVTYPTETPVPTDTPVPTNTPIPPATWSVRFAGHYGPSYRGSNASAGNYFVWFDMTFTNRTNQAQSFDNNAITLTGSDGTGWGMSSLSDQGPFYVSPGSYQNAEFAFVIPCYVTVFTIKFNPDSYTHLASTQKSNGCA